MSKEYSIEEIAEIFKERKPEFVEKHKFFSVLMPLTEKDGKTYVLFEVRARHMKSQPGEVCFPGGKMEKGETPLNCALRETREELGIGSEKISIIHELDQSRNYAGATIYRFLGKIEYADLAGIEPSENEVDTVFLVPLSFFMENEPEIMTVEIGTVHDYSAEYFAHGLGADYDWGTSKMPVPFYRYPEYPDFPIWGLTGRMMQNFVKIIKEADA